MPGIKPSPIDVLVGRNVQLHRMAAGLSEQDLARKLGTTAQRIAEYEKGLRRIGAAGLVRIAAVLRVPIPLLFEGAGTALSEPDSSRQQWRS
jgi:transcriptional regulator with XRE-family HTH domain